MAIAKMRHDWDMASVIWSAIANSVRDPKKQSRPFMPTDVHPFRQAERETIPFEALKILITEFNGRSKRNPGR